MKPRDPRRILHNNAPQKDVTVVSDQPKVDTSFGSAMIGNLSTPTQEDQLEKKTMSSSSMKPPDIAMQFTSNLKNIADILSVSQACTPSPVPQSSSPSPVVPQSSSPSPVPQSPSPQPAQCQLAGRDTKGAVGESGKIKNGSDLKSKVVTSGPPRPLNANAWSDVEHLFEGFDDQQKVAIQRERARRLEEQNKMFSVRKLCLVLDLDHTLLNSAKA